MTTSGRLDLDHPALRDGAVVITTERGARALSRRLPPGCDQLTAGLDTLDLPAALGMLRDRGHSLVVSEAGPRLFGSLLAADLVDELFLTQSPLLAGRDSSTRLALVEGVTPLPERHRAARLVSVRRSGDHLFLRYELCDST